MNHWYEEGANKEKTEWKEQEKNGQGNGQETKVQIFKDIYLGNKRNKQVHLTLTNWKGSFSKGYNKLQALKKVFQSEFPQDTYP